jgi:hypothetical protein
VALRKNGSEGPQPELEAVPTAVASRVTVPPQAAPGKFRYSRLGGFAAVALCLLVGVVLGFNVGGIRDRFLARNHPPQIQSIAVLPLANLSGDPTQDYFADGMTDELITALAKHHSLRVVSRTSAMQYRGARRPLREIARELGGRWHPGRFGEAVRESSAYDRAADLRPQRHAHMGREL